MYLSERENELLGELIDLLAANQIRSLRISLTMGGPKITVDGTFFLKDCSLDRAVQQAREYTMSAMQERLSLTYQKFLDLPTEDNYQQLLLAGKHFMREVNR